MDHKSFLSSLSPDQRAALTTRSDAKGLAHLAGHMGAILLCTLWIITGAPFWQAGLVVQGILLVFLFTLLHETSHKTPFESGWINTAVGHLCGLILFLPANWFRFFHFAHHRFTQIEGKDPELDAPKPDTLRGFIIHVSGLPIWGSQARVLLRNARGHTTQDYIPEARRTGIQTESLIYLAVYACLLGLSLWAATPVLLYVWLGPMLLGQPFLRIYLLAEHGRCPLVANMFENTRTTFTNRLVRFIAWNMPYHSEHHSYPSVPFYKLPDLHQLTKPHLLVTENGYAAFGKAYVQEGLSADRPS